jgi:transposase
MENYRAKQSKGDETSSSSSSSSSSSLLLPSPNTPLHSHLSHDQRVSIIALHEADHTNEDISKRMNRTERTIEHWIAEFPNNPTLSDHPRSGRPPLFNKEEQQEIVASSQTPDDQGKKIDITPQVVINRLHLERGSQRTVSRVMDEEGYRGRVCRKSTRLTATTTHF